MVSDVVQAESIEDDLTAESVIEISFSRAEGISEMPNSSANQPSQGPASSPETDDVASHNPQLSFDDEPPLSPPPPPSPKIPHYPVYIAKYDYSGRTHDDLSFKKGDLLYIISNDGDWWFARSKESIMEGYIPSTYVAKWNTLDAEE